MYQLVISVETVEMDQSITRRQKCAVVFQKKKLKSESELQ